MATAWPTPPDLHTLAVQSLDTCLGWLDDALDGDDVDTAVHEVRRTCKQVRALLRLVRTHDPDLFRAENRATRDAAALLSDLRDATVSAHALSTLERPDTEASAPPATGGTDLQPADEARRLADRHTDLLRTEAMDALRACRDALTVQRQRSATWDMPHWDDPGEVDAIVAGWTATYRAARRAGKRARKKLTAATLHEWRKRTKDHRLQIEFLADLDPTLAERAADLHRLTDLLGDDHDLAMLASTLQQEGQTRTVATIAERRHRVQSRARKAGKALFTATDDEMGHWLRDAITRT